MKYVYGALFFIYAAAHCMDAPDKKKKPFLVVTTPENEDLVIAAAASNYADVTLLLEQKSDPNVFVEVDGVFTTPLLQAAHDAHKKDNPLFVQLLLDARADVNAFMRPSGATPLMLAAQRGSVNIMGALLRAPLIRINDQALGHYNTTALHQAARWGHTTAVRLLLDHGADVTVVQSDGNTPLMLATGKKIKKMLNKKK